MIPNRHKLLLKDGNLKKKSKKKTKNKDIFLKMLISILKCRKHIKCREKSPKPEIAMMKKNELNMKRH